jgi:hypothetical protein
MRRPPRLVPALITPFTTHGNADLNPDLSAAGCRRLSGMPAMPFPDPPEVPSGRR